MTIQIIGMREQAPNPFTASWGRQRNEYESSQRRRLNAPDPLSESQSEDSQSDDPLTPMTTPDSLMRDKPLTFSQESFGDVRAQAHQTAGLDDRAQPCPMGPTNWAGSQREDEHQHSPQVATTPGSATKTKSKKSFKQTAARSSTKML